MIIYKATNLVNGKVYIGQTIGSLKRRMAGHKCESRHNRKGLYFYNSICKHGMDAFAFEVIDSAKTMDELNEREIFWIERYDSANKKNGYNANSGGMNSLNSAITRQKISKGNKGRVFTEEHCRRISEGKKGWVWTPEIRKTIMAGRKKINFWPKETRERVSIMRRRENLSTETRLKISKANSGSGNGRAMLSDSDVVEIKTLINSGLIDRVIAERYNIGRTAISKIKLNKTWRHIPWP